MFLIFRCLLQKSFNMDRPSLKIKFQFSHMCVIVSLARELDILQIGSLIVIQV